MVWTVTNSTFIFRTHTSLTVLRASNRRDLYRTRQDNGDENVAVTSIHTLNDETKISMLFLLSYESSIG